MLFKRMLVVLFLFTFLILPAPGELAPYEDFPVTSDFGWRIHPIYGDWRFHAGVDLGYAEGDPVPALFDGVVVQCGDFDDGYGNQVLLYHPAIDCYTRYAHLSSVAVYASEEVYAGMVIGNVGQTGNVTGPHLHLEYIAPTGDGAYVYMNPLALWGMA